MSHRYLEVNTCGKLDQQYVEQSHGRPLPWVGFLRRICFLATGTRVWLQEPFQSSVLHDQCQLRSIYAIGWKGPRPAWSFTAKPATVDSRPASPPPGSLPQCRQVPSDGRRGCQLRSACIAVTPIIQHLVTALPWSNGWSPNCYLM
jgi:hypothetical protein